MRRLLRNFVVLVTRLEIIEVLAVSLANIVGRLLQPKHKPHAKSPHPIDAVYLWVDDSDPIWQQKKAKFEHRSPDADSASRFREFGELQTSIRLLAKNAPWLRKVFIVTDSQNPDLQSAGSLPFEIGVIDHEVLLSKTNRPTFSSRALTANLHKIPDLSEHFIYMNDDTFIAAPSSWNDFFETTDNGEMVAKLRNTTTKMPPLANLPADEIVYNSRYHSNAVAAKQGWSVQEGPPEHGGHAMHKSVIASLWKKIPDEMSRATSEKFRKPDTILPEWLHDSYAFSHGKAINASGLTGYKYVAVNRVDAVGASVDALVRRGRILVLCLNDEAGVEPGQSIAPRRLQRRMTRVLSSL